MSEQRSCASLRLTGLSRRQTSRSIEKCCIVIGFTSTIALQEGNRSQNHTSAQGTMESDSFIDKPTTKDRKKKKNFPRVKAVTACVSFRPECAFFHCPTVFFPHQSIHPCHSSSDSGYQTFMSFGQNFSTFSTKDLFSIFPQHISPGYLRILVFTVRC